MLLTSNENAVQRVHTATGCLPRARAIGCGREAGESRSGVTDCNCMEDSLGRGLSAKLAAWRSHPRNRYRSSVGHCE